MKFQWIGTGCQGPVRAVEKVARIAIITLMLLSSGIALAAEDEDIPPPADAEAPAAKAPAISKAPGAEAAPPVTEDDTIPAPSLGEETLPEPSANRAEENPQNQVNQAPAEDDVFLPTPGGNDSINDAPLERPATRLSSNDAEWRVLKERPVFSLYLGPSFKSYPNPYIAGTRFTGIQVGGSVRMFDLAQTVFLHLYADYSWYSIGNVGPDPVNAYTPTTAVAQVKDETVHVGPMIEFGVGRHFSLFASFLRRQARVSADRVGVENVGSQNLHHLDGIGEAPTWRPGIGAQLDFYVIPHGSLGLHAQLEQNFFAITLAVAMEPVPRKKLSLNFDEAQ